MIGRIADGLNSLRRNVEPVYVDVDKEKSRGITMDILER